MLIPLGTDQPKRRPTLITWWLIGLNVVMYAVMVVLERLNPEMHSELLRTLWLARDTLGLGIAITPFHWWSLFTYQFLHADMLHLLGNCLFLYVFGPLVEDRFQRLGFTAFYLAGGALAGVTHLLLDGERVLIEGMSIYFVSPVIGASGSIAAVTGAFLVLFPLVRVRVLLFFFLIGVYAIPAWWMIVLNVVTDILMSRSGRSIAYMAHLGGYAVGFITAWALLASKVIARQPYDLFSIHRQAKRRREFKEITSQRNASSPWLHDTGAANRKARRLLAPSSDAPTGPATGSLLNQPAPEAIALAERRAAIAALIAQDNLEQAARDYEQLLNEEPSACLHHDAQMQLANTLYALSRHQAAAVAYQLLLAKHPHGRESDEIRLLLALLNARYLNDPVEAKRLISAIQTDHLSEAHRNLLNTLIAELG